MTAANAAEEAKKERKMIIYSLLTGIESKRCTQQEISS